MNVITCIKKKTTGVVKKIVAVAVSASLAIGCMAMSAFAEEASGSTVDMSSVTTAMTSSLTDLVGKAALACAAVVGVGLTIFGIKWVVKTIKSFFSKIAG